MENNLIQNYELSVWEDIVPSIGKDAEYLDEEKIATIGAAGWDSPIKAYDVTLTENINGEKTLTFNILRKYRNDKGELVDNPFIPILTNERKLKLRIGEPYNFYNEKGSYDATIAAQEDKEDRWIDFLIKTVDENKKTYVNTFTCKEAYVTELGKNGYATTLKTELENNYGTLTELAERILEHSGWTVGSKYVPREYSKEVLFIPVQTSPATKVKIKQMIGDNELSPSQLKLYTFYSELENVNDEWHLKSTKPQVYYKANGFSTDDADDERVVIDENDEYNYLVTGSISKSVVWTPLNTGLQGKRIVESNYMHYESVKDRYVTDYKVLNSKSGAAVGSTVYGYETAEYLNTESVQNLVVNSKNFVSTTGWIAEENVDARDIMPYPNLSATYARNCLILKNDKTKAIKLWNAGLTNQSEPFSIVKDKKYVIRLRARSVNLKKSSTNVANGVSTTTPLGEKTGFYVGVRDWNHVNDSGNGWIKGMYAQVRFPSVYATKADANSTNALRYGFPVAIKKENRATTVNKWLADDAGYIYRIFQAGEQTSAASSTNPLGVSISTAKNNYGADAEMNKKRTAVMEKLKKANITYELLDENKELLARCVAYDRVNHTTNGWDYDKMLNKLGPVVAGRVDEIMAAIAQGRTDGQLYRKVGITNAEIYYFDYKNFLDGQTVTTPSDESWVIEDIQFFEYKEQTYNGKTIPLFPGDAPEAEYKVYNHFYNIQNKKDIGLSANTSYYAPVKRANYAAVRHLEIEKSNYFNNINSLAELFEVWVGYRVAHQKDGRIFKENGAPKKQVLFSKFSPFDRENWAGFKYGINVDDIKRNTVSDAISTKIIVADNVNEFAKDGICSIVRAIDNISGERNLFNFDYYVNQGLLNQSQVVYDLYNGKNGYLAKLGAKNKLLLPLNETIQSKLTEAKRNEEYHTQYTKALETIEEEIAEQDRRIRAAKGLENSQFLEDLNQTKKVMNARRESLKKDLSNYEDRAKKAYSDVYGNPDQKVTYQGFWNSANSYSSGSYVRIGYNFYKARITNRNKKPTNSPQDSYWEGAKRATVINNLYNESLVLSDDKRLDDETFYKKYSRFIQEGTWSDNNYIDDNAYYLDAKKVLAQSAYPKVTYTISVVDISGIKKYAGYTFKVGERTYLEDTDFFGWIYTDAQGVEGLGTWKTPFKKEVIIAERTRNFDDASKSRITVQTYRNQWKDLFSKLTAATQTLSFNSGGYQRAANLVDETGQLKTDKVLAALNKINTSNTQVESLITPSGFVAGSGVSLDLGVPAASLTGQIDIATLNITSSTNDYAFTWDAAGLNAYLKNASAKNKGLNGQVYVRYNDLGIFGTSKGEEIDKALALNKDRDELVRIKAIKDLTTFFLTWDGLYLNSDNGKLKLDPERGLEIYSGTKWPAATLKNYDYIYDGMGTKYTKDDDIPIVSLGRLGLPSSAISSYYGLRLRNDEGYITMETSNRGNLILRNQLRVGEFGAEKEYSHSIEEVVQVFKTYVDVPTLQGGFNTYADYRFSLKNKPIPNSTVKIANITNDFIPSDNNTIIEFTVDADGQPYTNEWHYDSSTGTYWTRRLIDQFTKQEQNPLPFPNGYYLSRYYITETIMPYVGLNGDGIGVNPIVFYAGYSPAYETTKSSEYEKAPFKIYADGSFVAKKADITGIINATDGIFSGAVKVGTTAGINGSADAAWVFYAGDGTSTEPTFYVTPDGEMVANNSHIKGDSVIEGTIFANEGRINRVYLNNSAELGENVSYIGAGTGITGTGGDDDAVYINIQSGNFVVDAQGQFFGEKLFLDRNESWSQQIDFEKGSQNYGNYYNIVIGPNDDYFFTIYNPIKNEDGSKQVVFDIRNNGIVDIEGTLNARNGLNLSGQLTVKGQSDNTIVIDGDVGKIYSFDGNNENGWWIDKTGSAEFNNVSVRGKISASVFEFNKITAVGGVIAVTPSIFVLEDIEKEQEENDYKYDITLLANSGLWNAGDQALIEVLLPDDAGGQKTGYTYGEIIIDTVQTEDGPVDKIYLKAFSKAEVTDDITGKLNEQFGINLNKDEDFINEMLDFLPAGSTIINTNLSHNSISLNAMNPKGATIQTTPYKGAGQQAQIKSTLLGYIDPNKVASSSFKALLEKYEDVGDYQYGLYSANAYIEGKLYLPSAGLTDEDNLENYINSDWTGTGDPFSDEETNPSDNNVRIWAGASPEHRTNAPFIVTQDGTLYANKGIFKGQIKANNSEFSGHIKASGVVLGQKDTPDYTHFYFTWLGDNIDNPTQTINVSNYIADFNKNGLNLWDSLTVFSRYYNGFYKDNHDEWDYDANLYNYSQFKLYGKNLLDSNENFITKGYWRDTDTPYPIFTILDRSYISSGSISIVEVALTFTNQDNEVFTLPARGNSLITDDDGNITDYIISWDAPSGDLGQANNLMLVHITENEVVSRGGPYYTLVGDERYWRSVTTYVRNVNYNKEENIAHVSYSNNVGASVNLTITLTQAYTSITPRISATDLQLWKVNNTMLPEAQNQASLYGLNLSGDHLYITKTTIGDSYTYDQIADSLWNYDTDQNVEFSLGHHYLDINGTQKEVTGVLAKEFGFSDFNGINTMKIFNNNGVRQVILGEQPKDKLIFGDQLEMIIESEGISFNYIGA